MAKNKNHDKLVKDYNKQKSEHLDKLATKMLKNDEKVQKLKEKKISTNFLKLF
jgi:hypothetical protein